MTYQEKIETRRERYERRAAMLERAATQAHKVAHDMASVIPFGQPILVGHHSEGRDRRYRDRIGRKFDQALEFHKKAEYYRSKAASVGHGGISSDDETAIEQLEAKVAKLEADQAKMVAANRLVRKKDRAGLAALGFSEKVIDGLFTPDFCGRIGFPDYATKNNGANIRRIKDRIEHLKRARQAETKETERSDGTRIVENVEANRLQIFFPGKPEVEIRTKLKSFGFRWSPTEGAWQRHLSNGARWAAENVLGVSAQAKE